jgi:hypothetical protein
MNVGQEAHWDGWNWNWQERILAWNFAQGDNNLL